MKSETNNYAVGEPYALREDMPAIGVRSLGNLGASGYHTPRIYDGVLPDGGVYSAAASSLVVKFRNIAGTCSGACGTSQGFAASYDCSGEGPPPPPTGPMACNAAAEVVADGATFGLEASGSLPAYSAGADCKWAVALAQGDTAILHCRRLPPPAIPLSAANCQVTCTGDDYPLFQFSRLKVSTGTIAVYGGATSETPQIAQVASRGRV